MHGQTQPTPHDQLINFPNRIIVAGTRKYDDYAFFSKVIKDTVELLKDDGPIVFYSGEAKTGADALIIRWCTENEFPWAAFPADWDKHGKSAGYIRNATMGETATRLIAFWDEKSKGTKHMIENAVERGLKKHVFIIELPKAANNPEYQTRKGM